MNKNPIKSIFSILFLDLLAFSSLIPLLPILFLNAQYFLRGCEYSKKLFILGLLYSMYPLAQLIGAPIWAKLADRLGRKKMLLMAYIGNTLGYLCSGYGVYSGQVSFLIIGNFIAGFLGFHISTMNAIISDTYEGVKRARYFGFIQFFLGLAFAIGPFISSKLLEKLPHVETLALFLFGAASFISLLNFFLINLLKFKEQVAHFQPSLRINLKGLSKNVLRPLLLTFLTTFGWYLFIKTFQIFLIKQNIYSPSEVLDFVTFYGLATVAAQGLFVLFGYKKINYRPLLYLSLLGLGASIGAFAMSQSSIAIYFNIIFISLFYCLIGPNLLHIFSQNHSEGERGQMMSAHQGVVSFAKIIAPALSGVLVNISAPLTIGISASGILFGFMLAPIFSKTEPASNV